MKKSISVVIPNYNGQHLLRQNLPSVFEALNSAKVDYEVILVDDSSSDGSVEFIRENYPCIKILTNQENSGFTISCNKGIRVAQKELVLLLNTDIKLNPGFFDGQFKYFEKEDTFGVMSRIEGADGETQDWARLYTFNGFKIKANKFFLIEEPGFWIPTAYLSGANALIDAAKLKQIGGFNELFSPFYYEDWELGLRAWRLGWTCYFHPDSYCIHDHSATTKKYKTASWVKSIFFRNRMIVHAIHLSPVLRFLYYLQIFLVDFMFMWLGLKFFYYNSLLKFVSNYGEVVKARRDFNQVLASYGSGLDLDDVIKKMDKILEKQNVILK